MASKKSRPQPPRRPRPAPAPQAPSLKKQITAGIAAAVKELGADAVPEREAVDAVDPAELVTLWQQAHQVLDAYRAAQAGLDARDNALAAEMDDLAARLAGLDELEAAAVARQAELAASESRVAAEHESLAELGDGLAERERALDERDRALLAGELALAGRIEREKSEIITEVRAELNAARQRADAALQELDEELDRHSKRVREQLETERKELDGTRAEVATQRQQLREWESRLRAREEDLHDTKQLYAERTGLAVTAATEQVQADVEHVRRLYEAARTDADRHSRRIAEFELFYSAFEGRDPAEVLQELEHLRTDSAELHRLRLTAPEEKARVMAALEEESRRLRERCLTYAAENERLLRQLSAHDITATSLERLTVTKEALVSENRAYRDALEEETRKWQGLVERREGASVFPACTAMDRDHPHEPDDLADEAPPLAELVDRIRALIRQQAGLFYEATDLRGFLGGMAATQLHLLQGISGIGKTQLPQRFAEAIGAASVVVSVGADWRTPQDLMGYYNAFERRFYESEFTKALYQAQCPQFAAQPFIIVLDEMNLSHPEQYFNDVLSAISRDADRTRVPDLVLMSSAIEPAPARLRGGRLLPVPPTVFFVGTANHDETTVSFADKTYDRANVIELPATPSRFDTAPVDPLPPLSFTALESAFDAAAAHHQDDAALVKEFLTAELAEQLAVDYRVSWGSRLFVHIDRHVPVVVAAGGSLSEAVDHLMATKILRKLRGRYEIRADRLARLRDDLAVKWAKLSAEGSPDRCLATLDDLVRDLGQQ